MASDYKYKRVLLKLSGEALMGEAGYGIDPKVVEELAVQIKEIVDDGIQLAVTVGGRQYLPWSCWLCRRHGSCSG